MKFEAYNTYHIFNQGNNRRQVFFQRANYLYFLNKMRLHLLPFGDLIAYCLMPNHFHWLFLVRNTTLPSKAANFHSPNPNREISLNDAIGIMLRSYTRAINKQEKCSGSIFRAHTKAKSGFINDFISVDSKYWKRADYVATCFAYIHNNPTKDGLVTHNEDWEFSSALDYAGWRTDSLCKIELGKLLSGIY